MKDHQLAKISLACLVLALGRSALASEPLPNLRLVTDGLYVGGEPKGKLAYDKLVGLGVKTLVSVDGIPPDAESAHARDIRVLHVPMGYDGVPDEATAALMTIASESDWPIYVHCHHGKHRGPAAAAILARAVGRFDANQAMSLLKESGTEPGFRGLWRDVAAFDPARVAHHNVELREAMPIAPFTLAMAQLGRAWVEIDNDGAAEDLQADPYDSADLRVFQEAIRETLRQAPGYDPTGVVQRSLESLQQAANQEGAKFDAVSIRSSCVSCHSQWRD